MKIVKGILALIFALLGLYCSIRGIQAHNDLGGRIDEDNVVRDWSAGAAAGGLGAACCIIFPRKKKQD
jgi:hypothetical protein